MYTLNPLGLQRIRVLTVSDYCRNVRIVSGQCFTRPPRERFGADAHQRGKTKMNTDTVANGEFVVTQVTADAKLVRKILSSAAHLVAAMYDPTCGMKIENLSPDVRGDLESLRDELFETGLLV